MPTKFTIPNNAILRYPIVDQVTNKVNTNSWFNYYGDNITTSYQNTDNTTLRCKPIAVKPNNHQRKLLIEWFDLYRFIYNKCVNYIKTNGYDKYYTLRPIIKGLFSQEIKNRISNCKILVDTIDSAIKDAVCAFKSSFALHKGKKHFRVRYKKINANQVLTLRSKAFSKIKNSFSKKIGIIETDSEIKGIKHDCKLTFRKNKFILWVPIDRVIKDYSREINCCSLDPGLRTFQTVYCDNGSTIEIGTNVINKLKPLIAKSNLDAKSKYKQRIRDKIKHMVDDLHWKAANLLCKTSNKILIGNLSTISILRGQGLPSEYKRLMQCVSHFTFRQRLASKCEEFNVVFDVVDESYTSKTCGLCGELNQTLKSSKVFVCNNEHCNFSIDRDVNGARNIMIKKLQ